MCRFLLAIFLFLSPANAFAGPFGTAMADPVEKYGEMRFLGTRFGIDNFMSTSLPKVTPPFTGYQLCFHERQLIGVAAISHEGSPEATMQLFHTLYQQLARQYGQEKLKLKRYVHWVASEELPLPDNLSSIKLIYGEQNGNFAVHVYYDYRNADPLKARIRADKERRQQQIQQAADKFQ